MSTVNLGNRLNGTAGAIALIDGLRHFTFAALDDAIARMGGALRTRGLAPGDRVGLLSLNRWEFAVAFLGAMRAGLVAVPYSFKLPRDTLDHIARDAELRLVLHDADRASLCPAGVPTLCFDDLDLAGAAPMPPVPVAHDALALILYTSGSTGRPKGVLLSHGGQGWAIDTALRQAGPIADQRYIVAAPMFHMNATFSLTLALAAGAAVVLLPSFEARAYADAIQRHRVTALTSVPTMMALLARAVLPTDDFSDVQRVMMGSAPLTDALVARVQAVFPNAVLTNSYGTTEAGPTVFGPHPLGLPRPPLSVGYPVLPGGVDLREGPHADEGVLFMRNPALMQGYNNLPDATAKALHDGWYRSGDIIRRDEHGFHFFVGRADDMFVVGGENVWPGEIERLLERMPEIAQAAIVPVADEIKGALPFAFVVARPGAVIDEAAVKRFALAHGPAFAHPRFVEFLRAIPLAATNKPDRRALTERAATLRRTA